MSSLDFGKPAPPPEGPDGNRECDWLDCHEIARVALVVEVWPQGHPHKVECRIGLCQLHNLVIADPCPTCFGAAPVTCRCRGTGFVGKVGVHLQLDKAVIDAAREGMTNR